LVKDWFSEFCKEVWFFLKRKGQGTFEYVLLLAGVLLIVVLAIVLLRGGIFGGGAKDVELQNCARQLAQSGICFNPAGQVKPTVKIPSSADSCIAFQQKYYPNNPTAFDECGEAFPGLPTEQGGSVTLPGGMPGESGTPSEITAASEDNKSTAAGLIQPPGLLFYTLKLSTGWNLVSTPIAVSQEIVCVQAPCPPKLFVKIQSTTCDLQSTRAWRFEAARQEYQEIDLTENVLLNAQEAYWVFVREDCQVVFNGDSRTTLSEWPLRAGWNSVAAPYSETLFNSIKGDCVVESGPWRWDTAALDYSQSFSLSPGNGFFVRVARDCVLASVSSESVSESGGVGVLG